MPEAWFDYELMSRERLLETKDWVLRYFQTVQNDRPNSPAKETQLSKLRASLIQMDRVLARRWPQA